MIKQQAQTKCAAEITQRLRGTWLHPQQPGILVITPKHNLHTAFGITALQQAQTKAASKRVFMKCNVQLKGEGVQTTTPQAFSFKEGFFFFLVTIHWHLLSIYSSDIKHQNAGVH